MPKFTIEEASRRLHSLSNTQQSIEKASKWIIRAKKHGKEVITLWNNEFFYAPPKQRLAYLHLVNDVLQRGINHAPEYFKLFQPHLTSAFADIAKIRSSTIRKSVAHLLLVWAERKVYPRKYLRQLRSACQYSAFAADIQRNKSLSEAEKQKMISKSPFTFSFTKCLLNKTAKSTLLGQSPEAGLDTSMNCFMDEESNNNNHNNHSMLTFKDELARDLKGESIEPPSTEKIISVLSGLTAPASTDGAIRRAIAEFKPEVSDVVKARQYLAKYPNSHLLDEIIEAKSILDKYNERLDAETKERLNLTTNLRSYRSSINDKAQQAKSKLKKIKSELSKVTELQEHLRQHLSNLPDVSADIVDLHKPLPPVNDLFR